MRVVVVDNDPDALELVVTDLRFEGHDIVGTALGGDDGLQVCARERPDVLVVDQRMPPGPDGVTVARRIRDEQPSIRVILYSNYRDQRVTQAARAAGAMFLPKGNLRALREAVAATPPAPPRG